MGEGGACFRPKHAVKIGIQLAVIVAALLMKPAGGVVQKAFKAGCACSGVKITTLGGPLQIVRCHCTDCRAATGITPSIWAAHSLSQTLVTSSNTLRVFRNSPTGADRFFCAGCGCSVAMLYHANSVWPEAHTIWLSSHFADTKKSACVLCDIFKQDEETKPDNGSSNFVMPEGPIQDQGAVAPVAAGEEGRLRLVRPVPEQLPSSCWIAVEGPEALTE